MNDDSYIPVTPQEWYEWLRAEELKTKRAFAEKPALLISSYSSERATTNDYEGREILELLQNAADQAGEMAIPGSVAVELHPEGLIVANTGKAFSLGGVQSLENAHLSPKRHRKRQFIGNKGLGFRAVLNWTRSPIILSGHLALSYSADVSAEKLGELTRSSRKLKELVDEELSAGGQLPVPVLPFPGYAPDGSINQFVSSEYIALYERCLYLRQSGYETAIAMPFSNPALFTKVNEQINSLSPEFLLFVENLKEVSFLLPENRGKVWSMEGDNDARMILENGEPIGIWQLFSKHGKVPLELLDEEKRQNDSFELKVAVQENLKVSDLKSSPLYCFFPTQIELPLPVICHATLELNQNRNHIVHCASNSYVFDQLASLLGEVAEKRASVDASGVNAGFRVVYPLKDFPNDFERESFEQKLLEEASTRHIVPTLSGNAVSASNAKMLSGADDSWLPVDAFAEFVPVTDSAEVRFFKNIGVVEAGSSLLVQRLVSAEYPDLSSRAAVIKGILDHVADEDVHTAALLLGRDGAPLAGNVRSFISPKSTDIPEMPDWVRLWFLNQELQSELMQVLESEDVRELAISMSSFGLSEYAFAALVGRIVAEANRYKKQHKQETKRINQELLLLLYGLFKAEGLSGKRPPFPDQIRVPLLNQAGDYSAAENLYMGEGYGNAGNVVQDLFGPWSEERLVVAPEKLGLGHEFYLNEFMSWIGVSVWPKSKKEKSLHSPAYRRHILGAINLPVLFGDYSVNTEDELNAAEIEAISSIDGLAEILKNSDSAAIGAWLVLDPRSRDWSAPATDRAQLKMKRGQDRNYRYYQGTLPSYISWKIKNTAWLLDRDRNPLKPKSCFMGAERVLGSVFPRPGLPKKQVLDRYTISKADLKEGWRRAGVTTDINDLDSDELYRILLELPKSDPEGRSAPGFYRWLLDGPEPPLDERGRFAEKFFQAGTLWGKYRGQGAYYTSRDLEHIDSEGLPQELISEMKVVDLPYRVGGEKVKRVLGVSPVERMDISQRINRHIEAQDFARDFEDAKPYFYLLRMSQTSQSQSLKLLQSLRLKVCSELDAELEYKDLRVHSNLPVWGWLIDEDTLYVHADDEPHLEHTNVFFADAIGAAVASIFRIGDGGDFARIFGCASARRLEFLIKLRGEVPSQDIDKVFEAFDNPDKFGFLLGDLDQIDEPEVVDIVETVKPTDNPPVVDDGTPESAPGSGAGEKEEGELTVTEKPHIPKPPTNRRGIQIKRRKKGASRLPRSKQKIMDGDFAERKAMEFEASDDPPRFPLRVGQITGYKGPGCDILSFDTEEAKERFRSSVDRSASNIARYIEVKGRSNEGVEIELRGNEKNAARTLSGKYYLYRLFRADHGDFTLSILQNPLASKNAIEESLYVHLDKAEEMRIFDLSGGCVPEDEVG